MPIARTAAAWVRRIVRARYGQLMLFWFAFLEATLLPIPLETVMAPYMQLRRDIIFRLATLGLLGFMASALLGYSVGALFFDEIGIPLIDWMGWRPAYDEVGGFLRQRGFWAMLLVALIPMPTQIAMIGAGALGVPLALFVPAVGAARGLRCYGVALAVWWFGDRVVAWANGRAQPR